MRSLRSTFTWLAASLVVVAFIPACEAPPKPGKILVVQPGNFETEGDEKLFRVDPASGTRNILSDFNDPAQGAEGVDPFDVAVEPSGHILVLSLRLSHRQLADLFCDEMTEISHIIRSSGTVLDDGRM
ncbi:MAG: hypothetical protein ACREYE_28700 [Gammaproteobacteria bacterium]